MWATSSWSASVSDRRAERDREHDQAGGEAAPGATAGPARALAGERPRTRARYGIHHSSDEDRQERRRRRGPAAAKASGGRAANRCHPDEWSRDASLSSYRRSARSPRRSPRSTSTAHATARARTRRLEHAERVGRRRRSCAASRRTTGCRPSCRRHPHDVDEVPVDPRHFHALVVLGRVVAAERPDRDHQQQAQPDEHVGAVQAGERVEDRPLGGVVGGEADVDVLVDLDRRGTSGRAGRSTPSRP